MTVPTIWYIRAQIVRALDDDFPQIVEAQFTDSFGRTWSVIDKAPVVVAADEDAWPYTRSPQPAFLGCTIVSRDRDETGGETVEVSTLWGIETEEGVTTFTVWADQLTTR